MSESQEQLNQIIAEYLAAEQSGAVLDHDQLLSDHPDLADELKAFFADHDRMHEFVEPLQTADGEESSDPHAQTVLKRSDLVERGQQPDHDAATLPPTEPMDSTDGASTPTPGTIVRYFGDYELLEEIARGGMGVVYKARQTSLNRIVALKMILAGQLAGEEDVQRFKAEAEAAANLDHPGIVPIYEIGEHDGQHYFSMGFVEGESLADRIKDGPLPPREAAEYTKKIAEAIAYAHERGVIHRDLKPGNVLLDRDGQPKVTDFGLAKKVEGDSGLTATGQILGTPSYMPPEQASGSTEDVGPLADVYSLGAVLYALLTARPPFQASTPLDTLMQVREEEPVSPRLINSTIPPDLETVCMKCLEKQPELRYPSAKDLADDLGRFLSNDPILAHPASSIRKFWSWSKRRPWGITAGASLLTAGIVCFAYYLWVENSFLKFAVQNPEYVASVGPRSSASQTAELIASIVFFGLVAARILFLRHAWKSKRMQTCVSPRFLSALGLLGAVGVACGVFTVMKSIDANIWEHRSLFPGLVAAPLCFLNGVVVLVHAIGEYESLMFGWNSHREEMTDEQHERVRQLLLSEDAKPAKQDLLHKDIGQPFAVVLMVLSVALGVWAREESSIHGADNYSSRLMTASVILGILALAFLFKLKRRIHREIVRSVRPEVFGEVEDHKEPSESF